MHEYLNPGEVKRLFKIGVILIVILLAVSILKGFREWSEPRAAYNTIFVTGEGEAFATPDVATFSFSVSNDAKTVGAAQDAVTERVNAIIEALNGVGVNDNDIRTTDYSVYPKYTYEPVVCAYGSYCPPTKQIPDGYTVTHSVSVKLRDTANAGQALALAGSNGATNISSLTFTIDDPESVMNEARNKAIAEAKKKAKTLAKTLGVDLVRVVGFNDNTYGGVYPMMYRDAAMGMGGSESSVKTPTIPTGENKVTSNVTITYEIR